MDLSEGRYVLWTEYRGRAQRCQGFVVPGPLFREDDAARKEGDEEAEDPEPGEAPDVVPGNKGIGGSREGDQGDRKKGPHDAEDVEIPRDHEPKDDHHEDHPGRPHTEPPELRSAFSMRLHRPDPISSFERGVYPDRQQDTGRWSPRQPSGLSASSGICRRFNHSPRTSSSTASRVRPSASSMRLTFLSRGALKKTVTRFRGPDRPWRRPRLTSLFARGLGSLLPFCISLSTSGASIRTPVDYFAMLRIATHSQTQTCRAKLLA